LVDDDICPASAFDFSSFCGGPNVYVIITQDGSWNPAGNFANSVTCSGGSRYFRTDFSGVDASCIIDYDLVCANFTGTDGDFANWTEAGGTASLYGDDDCTVQTTVLPIALTRFDATVINEEVLLEWRTASEQDNELFTIERSSDGSEFEIVAELPGAGTTSYTRNYDVTDHAPLPGVSYYRLKQTDFDGHFSYSAIKAVEIELNDGPNIGFVYCGDSEMAVHYSLGEEAHILVELLDVTGRKVYETSIEAETSGKLMLPTTQLAEGIFFVRLSNDAGSDIRRFKL
jgi:hypothetical protein